MQIRATNVLQHPCDLVYRTYRDRLPELAVFMPEIAEIRLISREAVPGGQRSVHLWIAARPLPRPAATALQAERLSWEDHAVWDDERREVTWNLVFTGFPERVTCRGTHSFSVFGPDQTQVALVGDLNLHLHGLPGVPAFLARVAGTTVERAMVAQVTPNLARVNRSLEQFLDAQDGR